MIEDIDARVQVARTRHLLSLAPDVAAHVLSLVAPAGGGGQGVRVSGSKEIPLPLNAKALEDANGLYSQLVNWCTSIARSMGLRPPATVLGWMRRDVDCDGFPSWAHPEDAAELVRTVAEWLSGHSEHLAGFAIGRAFFDDLRDELLGPLLGRYPQMPRRPATAARECPVCDRRTVIVNFDEEGDGVMVACTFCGHEVPESVVTRFLPVLASESGGSES